MSNSDTLGNDALLGEFQALVRDFRAHLSSLSESLPADSIAADEAWLNQRREQYRRAANEVTLDTPTVAHVPEVSAPSAASSLSAALNVSAPDKPDRAPAPSAAPRAMPRLSPEPAGAKAPVAAQVTGTLTVAAPASSPTPAAIVAPVQPLAPPPAVQATKFVIQAPTLSVPARPAPRVLDVEPRVRLGQLREEVSTCRLCGLCETRTQTVFSRGTGSSGVVFVGEGPGADEDAQGEPFVGKAGQLLDRMIGAMGLERDAVYVCNVVKCRPPDNRKPEEPEMAACRPYLTEQLELLQPRVIVALGATAVQGLLGLTMGITRLRGQWRLYQGRIPVMPTFHPAYLLRQPTAKREVWQDLQAVLEQVGLKAPGRPE